MKTRTKPAILVVWAGRHRRSEWSALYRRYLDRIARRVALEEVAVRSPPGDSERRLESEAEAILAAVPRGAYLVALDSGGKQHSSPALARWLSRRLEDSRRPLVFAIGSDLGLGASVRERAQERLSFGLHTLPHELVRVVLYEQVYRGLSILGGMKYHREPL